MHLGRTTLSKFLIQQLQDVTLPERLILIAADDNRCTPHPWSASVDPGLIVAPAPAPRQPVRALVLGWNSRVPAIVRGIAAYVPPGSTLRVVSSDPAAHWLIP